MRVVYLSPSAQLGGAELSLLDVMACMRARAPQSSLTLIAGDEGPLIDRAARLGVDTVTLPFPRAVAQIGDAGAGGNAGAQVGRGALTARLLLAAPGVASYVSRLRTALRNRQPDIIHTNGFKMHVLGSWARPADVPVLWHVRDYVSARPLAARFMKALAPTCTAAIANSESVARDLRTVCGDGLRVHAVHNRIDVERFSPVGATLDLDAWSKLPPAADGMIRVGLPATFARWKGHDVFLKALSILCANRGVRGYVIGGALYKTAGSQYTMAELRSLARDLGVEQTVGFTGYVDDPAAALRSLDIVVHASTQPEPFGRVIVEAMACGKAVIVSRGGGASELIDQDTNAVSFTPGRADELAQQIEKLAADDSLRQALGRAGRDTALKRFDRAHLADEIIRIYESVR